MKEINSRFEHEIRNNFDENVASANLVQEYLKNCGEICHERYLRALQIPKIYDNSDIHTFNKIVSVMYGICNKMIKAYIEDSTYRKIFPFSKEIEELILVPRNYQSLLPIARFDIFYNEDTKDFKFCEINTDGTSAMNEDRELCIALSKNTAFNKIKQEYNLKPFELFDTWIQQFLNIYDTYKYKVSAPHVAIIDFMEQASTAEFYEFKRRFEKAGISAEVCEIRNMKYKDEALYSPSGKKVDAVYRRAVTGDIERHFDEVSDFLQAAREERVCVIGAFCTQIVHNKWAFIAMHRSETLNLLSKEEQAFIEAHIPKTYMLSGNECDIKNIKQHKDNWIIKPLDSYGSRGVYAGINCTYEEWISLINSNTDAGYIVQEYCTPFTVPNIYLIEDKEFKPYSSMPGLYVYNGKFCGVYSRLSDGKIISSDEAQYNKKVAATLLLEK